MESIEIGNKKYKISCHASCYREYADFFDRNILKDIQTAQKFLKLQFDKSNEITRKNPKADINVIADQIFEETLEYLDEFIECITKLCWICIHDNDENLANYDIWYKSLNRLSLNDDWIMEVLAILADCFR